MNKYVSYAGIPIAVILAFIVVFTVQPLYAAVIIGIPLMFLGRKYSGISGFVIGLAVPFSILLSYPISEVIKLSGIVGQLTGMPGILILIIYPLMYGILGGISALFFTGIRELVINKK